MRVAADQACKEKSPRFESAGSVFEMSKREASELHQLCIVMQEMSARFSFLQTASA